MEDLEQFANLLNNLLSPDNESRSRAEGVYDGIGANLKLPMLVEIAKNQSLAVEIRTLDLVLMRRLFTSNFSDCWDELNQEMKMQIQLQLLLCIKEENNSLIRKKMCDAVAELARNLLDDDNNMLWDDILKSMFEWASSENISHKESAYLVFASIPGIFGNKQNHYLEVIKQMLAQGMTNTTHKEARFAAVKATCSFVLANEKDTQIQAQFRELLPAILQGVADSVTEGTDSGLLKSLIDLAETTPKFLRSQLELVVQLSIKIIENQEIESNWRQLALEVIVTMSETASAMIRKVSKFLNVLVPLILKMMVELEEDEDWNMQDKDEDDEENSIALLAESALDRLSCGLGGSTMLPHIVNNVKLMLGNSDWKYRHAALMAISASGEGCRKQMQGMLEGIVDTMLPFTQDEHPRVRYAVCNGLGQMSTDFKSIFQAKFHSKVIPALLMLMEDPRSPRVQAHAGAALVNFSEGCPKKILAQYLDLIIEKLDMVLREKFQELLEHGNKLVLEQVLTTLASVADTVEEKFAVHYDRFMPNLKYILMNATQPDLRMLRGKAIECISLIGLAVGREKFMSDCNDVMEMLVKTQADWSELPDDDPQISYMISGWTRMCKIMGPEFQRYLSLVMGPILKAAMLKPEVALVDSEDVKAMENDPDWQFVTLGDQQSFGIKTSGLEEKAMACKMLVCYARELKEGFAEYTEQVVKLMVSHLKFYFHDGVRVAAAEAFPYLLACAKIKGVEYQSSMWQYLCPELLKALEAEPETGIKSEHIGSLAACIEAMGEGCLTEENGKLLLSNLNSIMKEHFHKQNLRNKQRADEDYDDDVEESLMEEDEEDIYMLGKVSEVIHSLLGVEKEKALPFFDQLLPHFVCLLETGRPWADCQYALCIYDDLVEYVGPKSANYQQYFLEKMVQSVVHHIPDVRQAAAYGIGLMAHFGGECYAGACSQAIPLLLSVIEDTDARQPANVNATENAISALTKICKYLPACIPGSLDEMHARWFNWLPVVEDEEEMIHVYAYLCDLVQANNTVILGVDNANLPKVIAIISEVFLHELISVSQDAEYRVEIKGETRSRMLGIVREVQNNEALFNACLSLLSDQQKVALSKALQG